MRDKAGAQSSVVSVLNGHCNYEADPLLHHPAHTSRPRPYSLSIAHTNTFAAAETGDLQFLYDRAKDTPSRNAVIMRRFYDRFLSK